MYVDITNKAMGCEAKPTIRRALMRRCMAGAKRPFVVVCTRYVYRGIYVYRSMITVCIGICVLAWMCEVHNKCIY